MEKLMEMIFKSDNIRTMVIMMAVIMAAVFTNANTDKKIAAASYEIRKELNGRIDNLEIRITDVEKSIDRLRYNDLAHIANGFKALTFVLQERKLITPEQKAHIDSYLGPAPKRGE